MSGRFEYTGAPVPQHGEIVVRNLPPYTLTLSYDTNTWEGELQPAQGNTQRLVLRNRKPGTQKTCVVRWTATR
jgi:hypothetical protein